MTLDINFLYLGGDKCGSTWIWHILSAHPDVTLARAKELFYFDRFYAKGPDWYRSQFPRDVSTSRRGEICHDYLYSRQALLRIAKDLPKDARFLITVRDPVDRAVSHYRYLKKIGKTQLPFDQALLNYPQIRDHSMFGKYVNQAQNILGADRVHVLPFQLLKQDSRAFGRQVCDAMGIEFEPWLPYEDQILGASTARHPGTVGFMRKVGWGLRKLGHPRLVTQVKSNPLVSRILYNQSEDGSGAFQINEQTLNWLRAEFVADQRLLSAHVPNLLEQCA